MIINNEALSARITQVGRVISGAVTSPEAAGRLSPDASFQRGFGTADEFMERYSRFQQDYIKALENNLDTSRLGKIDLNFLKSGGKIDLSVLTKDVRKQFEARFRDDVLNLPSLFKAYGIPNVELPSANLFRRAFRYEVDTGRVGRRNASNDGSSQ